MNTLPKHTVVKLVNIYGEELDGTIIPLSIKGTMDVEEFIDNIKNKLINEKDEKYVNVKKSLDAENIDETELFDQYVESKITMDLMKLNEDVTEERIKSLKEKRAKKLLEGKTRDNILNELTDIALDIDIRKHILFSTVSRTLWNVLRKPDNLREHLFIDVEDLENSLDQDTLVSIFNQNVDEAKSGEDNLKN